MTRHDAIEIDGHGQRMASMLRTAGVIDDAGLNRALRVAAETGDRLDHVVARLGLVGERTVARLLAQMLDLPLVEADALGGEEARALLGRLGRRFAESARVLPLADDGETVRLAMADPLDGAVAKLAAMKLSRAAAPCVAAPGDLESALERLGAEDGDATALAPAAGAADADDLARLKDMASEAPVVRQVNAMIRRAAELGASDIHVEPFENRLHVRYRIDGALQEAEAPPASMRAALVSRLKIMARLDIAETRQPQDGRVNTVALGRPLDLRIATAPTLHGEGVVIRLLDRTGLRLDYEALGVEPRDVAALTALTDRPNGVVLVTGPTGSGKTTTLYATLSRLNAPDRKIVTVEDPVEYQLDGVSQIQVDARIGLGFAQALRSILRQDPDIIMVGEIRDAETARIAVQAALTGHLVLATLHTNSAAAAVHRLRDMGVPPYLLAATLSGAVAQRLTRRLCPDCATPDTAAEGLARRLGLDATPRTAPGCAACRGIGARGRLSVMEVLRVDDAVRDLILSGGDERTISEAAIAGGMRPLREHALARAAAGEIALSEVARVVAAL